jgi:hypothetical protein
MKQQEVFNKIGGIIKELNDQYKYLETIPGELNDLELELFVANTHFLADHAEILRKVNKQSVVNKPIEKETTDSKEKYFEPLVQHSEPATQYQPQAIAEHVPQINLEEAIPEDTHSYIRQEPEIIRHELIVDESPEDDENDTSENEGKSIPAINRRPALTKTADIAIEEDAKPPAGQTSNGGAEPITINQKISAQLGNKEGGAAEQVTAQPISDLKAATTLNDKLLYVKDLFNGYSLAYNEAIDILNRFNTFDEAERFLNKNYVIKNGWENKQETTEKFYALLKRRYS